MVLAASRRCRERRWSKKTVFPLGFPALERAGGSLSRTCLRVAAKKVQNLGVISPSPKCRFLALHARNLW